MVMEMINYVNHKCQNIIILLEYIVIFDQYQW
jgi:hypothetical protein